MKILEFIKQDKTGIALTYVNSSAEFYETLGLKISDIHFDPVKNNILFNFFTNKQHQGHEGFVHGGIIASLCDSAIGILGMISSIPEQKIVFTANLAVTYVKVININEFVHVEASIKSREGKKLFIDVVIKNGNEDILATSEGLLIEKPFTIN